MRGCWKDLIAGEEDLAARLGFFHCFLLLGMTFVSFRFSMDLVGPSASNHMYTNMQTTAPLLKTHCEMSCSAS
jgi:hypothetical protein